MAVYLYVCLYLYVYLFLISAFFFVLLMHLPFSFSGVQWGIWAIFCFFYLF